MGGTLRAGDDEQVPPDRPRHRLSSAPSVQEWLPEGHLSRYVVEVVEGLDLGDLERAYAGKGSAAYHPALLLSLLIYGYATGCYSSRKIEQATYDSLAFRYIACNRHPDHDTLANFRKRFGKEFEAVFVEVLQVARENQLSRLAPSASTAPRSTPSQSPQCPVLWACRGHRGALKAEVQELLALAEQADGVNVPDGMSVPAELQRREDRLAAIAEAKGKIEARAAERYAREQADYQAKLAVREAKGQWQEAWRQGPQAARAWPACRGSDQPHRRSLADHGRGRRWLRSVLQRPSRGRYRDHAGDGSQVTQAANDKQQVVPMVEKLQALPEGLNQPGAIARRCWVLQRNQRGRLRGRRHRAADCRQAR